MLKINQIEDGVKGIAQDLKLKNPEIHVEMPGRWVHILIATPDFQGKTPGERENIIWRELERRFDDDTLLAITQCYLLTPEEKAIAIPG